MEESILTSIKRMLGPSEDYDYFDPDLIIHINSVFMVLTQLGVGPSEGFSIKDKTTVWSDFISDISKFEAVKTYVYLRVKLLFDPPLTSSVMEAMKSQISELEWRMNVIAENKEV